MQGKIFAYNHFGFGFCVRNAAVVVSVFRNDCHCSQLCVELCPAVLALEDIHITDRNFRNLLLPRNHVEEIKAELTRNKGETEASDNYLYQRMC